MNDLEDVGPLGDELLQEEGEEEEEVSKGAKGVRGGLACRCGRGKAAAPLCSLHVRCSGRGKA